MRTVFIIFVDLKKKVLENYIKNISRYYSAAFFFNSCSSDLWDRTPGLNTKNSTSSLSFIRWMDSIFKISFFLFVPYYQSHVSTRVYGMHTSFFLREQRAGEKEWKKYSSFSFFLLCFVTRSIILIFYIFLPLVEKKGWFAVAQQRAGLNGTCNEGIIHTHTPIQNGSRNDSSRTYSIGTSAMCVWLYYDPLIVTQSNNHNRNSLPLQLSIPTAPIVRETYNSAEQFRALLFAEYNNYVDRSDQNIKFWIKYFSLYYCRLLKI